LLAIDTLDVQVIDIEHLPVSMMVWSGIGSPVGLLGVTRNTTVGVIETTVVCPERKVIFRSGKPSS
jgi:hypothetical protein